MKTLIKITLVLLTISFISCDNKTVEERHNERLHSKLSVVNYDGHDYIIYTDGNGYSGMGGICHSESCSCKTIN